MLRRAALVRNDVSEELSASIIRVTRIGELGATLAVTSNRHTLQKVRKKPLTFFSLSFFVECVGC
jgi:demethoxyubiquinone hydroxylase (CLK1/Coq7/Cat5 family)